MYIKYACTCQTCLLHKRPVFGAGLRPVFRSALGLGFLVKCDHGDFFESYQPSNGEPILNPGFQNWNFLVLIMIAWLEGRETVREL